ncbi:MAG: M2 family metallopeptidase [Holophagales bacterium]|nr:M2 family metallopeptidase [Holophagales bacterium]
MQKTRFLLPLLALALALVPMTTLAQAPTAADAKAFVEKAEEKLQAASIAAERANWVAANFITEDTELIAADANQRRMELAAALAKEATRFGGLALDGDVARKLALLKLSLTLAAPADPKKSEELARIAAGMEGAYGRGKWTPPGGEPLDVEEISRRLATSRDPKELAALWAGWHTVGAPLRKDYVRYVELGNAGAKELGFADMGAMWRSKYDMPPDAYAKELDRLWEQVRPLYTSLHAYVRMKLVETYGKDVVPEKGPIPAHLLGNMWAQQWGNLYPLLAPKDADPGYDLTKILVEKKTDARQMVRTGEGFFTSLGFGPLPKSFWERSLFTRPRDREVVCHASAWCIDWADDLRLKMCIEINADDFATVHHELGHNFYQRAYNRQPFLFRDSANDGFHEAIGDTVALSLTPEYLVKIDLLPKTPPPGKEIGYLLNLALDKIAFLPFGLLIDKWRWQAFSGEVPEARWNQAWWDLKRKYQGVVPPMARTEADFDPGAKYHVASGTPYSRYFLADVLQFQMHRALAKTAGCATPIHTCSIYGNKDAGARLIKMLEMGQSRPWPDALEAVTGQRQMDATAILDYFAPLQKWLDEQTKGVPKGW